MDTAIVVFTRDLRLHDNPALRQARRFDTAGQYVARYVPGAVRPDPARCTPHGGCPRPGAGSSATPIPSSS